VHKAELRHAFHVLCALASPAVWAAPLELKLLGVDGRGVGGTVITLRHVDASRPLAAPVQATLEQVNLSFKPDVLVVPAGSKITFPNTDKVSHQVYSFSPTKRFQLPLYRGTPYPPMEFEKRGVVTLGCNIHDQMRAYVYVVEAQYYGRMDKQGLWKVPDVVPGEYTVQVWHPLARDSAPLLETRITVTAATPTLALRLATEPKLRADSRIPANWDAY
jgi:plastocyanin